mgnify:FL=1
MSLYEVLSTVAELNRMRSNKPEKADVSDDEFEAFERRMRELNYH